MTKSNIALILTLSVICWVALGFGALWVANLTKML